MNVNDVTTLISTIGFPIVMCGAMAWYIKHLTETHRNEVNELVESIHKNTEKIIELIDSVREVLK